MCMVQNRNMELEDARWELCKCGEGLVGKLAVLEQVRQCRAEVKLPERVAYVQAMFALRNKVFKKFEAVEAWKSQATATFQRRKKFPVRAGFSDVGKTEYVRGVFGPEALVELSLANCAGGPDLRAFDYHYHKVVLFDEACVEMLLKNR